MKYLGFSFAFKGRRVLGNPGRMGLGNEIGLSWAERIAFGNRRFSLVLIANGPFQSTCEAKIRAVVGDVLYLIYQSDVIKVPLGGIISLLQRRLSRLLPRKYVNQSCKLIKHQKSNKILGNCVVFMYIPYFSFFSKAWDIRPKKRG